MEKLLYHGDTDFAPDTPITIQTVDGPAAVDAVIRGPLAVHLDSDQGGQFVRFSITHIASGVQVTTMTGYQNTLLAVQHLRYSVVDWDNPGANLNLLRSTVGTIKTRIYGRRRLG